MRSSFAKSNSPFTAKWRLGGVFDVEAVEQRPGIVVFQVSGKDADAAFRDESGGHRWQRIPPNEKRGRVQTSTVTVAVLGIPTEAQVRISPNDLEWIPTRGSGPGGQNRNKVETAVILKHLPSGTMVRCETERSLKQNKESALSLLRARLWAVENDRIVSARASARKSQVGSGMRGDKRRTIRCQDGNVTDHLTGRRWSFRDYERGNW